MKIFVVWFYLHPSRSPYREWKTVVPTTAENRLLSVSSSHFQRCDSWPHPGRSFRPHRVSDKSNSLSRSHRAMLVYDPMGKLRACTFMMSKKQVATQDGLKHVYLVSFFNTRGCAFLEMLSYHKVVIPSYPSL